MTKLVAFENVRQRPAVLHCERIAATGLRSTSSADAVYTKNDDKSFIFNIHNTCRLTLMNFSMIFAVAKKIFRMRLAAAQLCLCLALSLGLRHFI